MHQKLVPVGRRPTTHAPLRQSRERTAGTVARRQAVSRRAVLQGRGSRESSASKAPSSWQVAAPAPQKGDLGRGPGMSSTDRWREGRRTVVLTEGLRGALEAFVLITATFPKTLQGQWEGITRSSLVTKKTGRVCLKFQRNSEGTPPTPRNNQSIRENCPISHFKKTGPQVPEGPQNPNSRIREKASDLNFLY